MFLVGVLIVILITVARSAWSGQRKVGKYAKYRKSLKSRESSSRKTSMQTPPLTTSGPSPHPTQQPAPQPAPRPAQRDDIQSQVDSLALNFQSLSETLTSQLTDFMNQFLGQSQSSHQPRLGPDAGESHPGRTAGESRMFQGEGAPSRTPLVPPSNFSPLPRDFRAPQTEQSSRAPPRSPACLLTQLSLFLRRRSATWLSLQGRLLGYSMRSSSLR